MLPVYESSCFLTNYKEMTENTFNSIGNPRKCYKSVSCIISVLIVLFVLGSIIYDLCWTKPKLNESISEIKTELTIINNHIDRVDSLQTLSIKYMTEGDTKD